MSNMDDEPHGYDAMGAPLSVPSVLDLSNAVRLPISGFRATRTTEVEDEPFTPLTASAVLSDLTYVYDPRPEPAPVRKPQEGDPFYMPGEDGVYRQVGVFGPTRHVDDEPWQTLYIAPRTWQSEGGDQA